MKPAEVPAEIVQAAYDALGAAPQPLLPHVAVPHTIAAAWPAIEAAVRQQIADGFRARAQTVAVMRDGVEDPVLDVTGSPISTDEIYRRLADEISPEGDLR